MTVKYYIQAVKNSTREIYFVAYDRGTNFYLTQEKDKMYATHIYNKIKEASYSVAKSKVFNDNFTFTICEIKSFPICEFNRAIKDDNNDIYLYKIEVKGKE